MFNKSCGPNGGVSCSHHDKPLIVHPNVSMFIPPLPDNLNWQPSFFERGVYRWLPSLSNIMPKDRCGMHSDEIPQNLEHYLDRNAPNPSFMIVAGLFCWLVLMVYSGAFFWI